MGQKVNPVSYRLQISKDWASKWFTKNTDFKKWLIEDVKIRETIENRFKARPTIARIEIERTDNLTTVTIRTAKAGAVIGKQGAGINELKKKHRILLQITSLCGNSQISRKVGSLCGKAGIFSNSDNNC